MKNIEVIKLTEVVNDVLQGQSVTDEQLDMLGKYARMGVEETGKTGYRLIGILAGELLTTRNGLALLVAESPIESVQAATNKANAELQQGEPQRTITSVPDPEAPEEELPVNDGPEEHEGEDDNEGEAGWGENVPEEQAAMSW